LKIDYKILGISLAFALISGGVYQFWYQFAPMLFVDYYYFLTTWSPIISVISYLINPIAILVVFFFLGKSYDLQSHIEDAIVSLIVGEVAGFYAAYVIGLGIMAFVYGSSFSGDALGTFLYPIIQTLLHVIDPFFVAFGGLALGYLLNQRRSKGLPSNGIDNL
jgi:hypothetical protein